MRVRLTEGETTRRNLDPSEVSRPFLFPIAHTSGCRLSRPSLSPAGRTGEGRIILDGRATAVVASRVIPPGLAHRVIPAGLAQHLVRPPRAQLPVAVGNADGGVK